MPELPDVIAYVECLRRVAVGRVIRRVQIISTFVLRTFDPTTDDLEGRTVLAVERLGKRFIFGCEGEIFAVIHLMIAGRFRWLAPEARAPGKIALATVAFDHGTLALTEASPKKRASLHVVQGREALAAFDSGGLDVLAASTAAFRERLTRGNHTLKRALTDPGLFDGIGNAYSDEILHAAQLSPIKLTDRLTDEEIDRLFAAAQATLSRWIAELRVMFADRFPGPGDVTAFREGFAVHGRFGLPCPACTAPVQRIRYADHETNYCPKCQTGGTILADRSLSRLLKGDWPRTLEELEGGA
jgi:formamidopyrimidine-DNA glycosylase